MTNVQELKETELYNVIAAQALKITLLEKKLFEKEKEKDILFTDYLNDWLHKQHHLEDNFFTA
ncbi:hypothetical protein LJC61_09385 [Ruminococcaceae bacterium OttesenSCG-928-A16]|nr:hypothetical protein [Ruminococcaceae bacterium OttesenSCG-928-A16]